MKRVKAHENVQRLFHRQKYAAVCFAAAMTILVIMAFRADSETVIQEAQVDAAGIYSFSFLSQQGSGEKKGETADSDEVYYSDAFFSRSNGQYDHDLARASLALAMTAFKEEYAAAFLGDMGYEDIAAYRYDQQSDEDKAALIMGHKGNILAVAVRGGKYGDEWGSNGRVGFEGESFGYHYGFHKAAEDAAVQIKEYAADNGIDLKNSAVWITGFSRGAAVANVLGAMLTGQAVASAEMEDALDSDSQVTISPESLFCYTFASPSTVSEHLLNSGVQSGGGSGSAAGIFNIVNPLDIVTRLPMNVSGTSETAKGKTVEYDWDYTKYGGILYLPSESESSQMQVVRLLENALAFATRNESRYVERNQDQVIIPALKKTLGKGADISKRNIGNVLVGALPGVAAFLRNELDQLDIRAQFYVASILAGKQSARLEKEHWPETYWGWMMKLDGIEEIEQIDAQ